MSVDNIDDTLSDDVLSSPMNDLKLVDKLTDDELLTLVESCDKFANIHLSLGKTLSDGFFNMAISRKSSSSFSSAENVRDEFDASVMLHEDSDCSVGYSIDVLDKGESIFLISGLPTPHLRKSQKCFRKSIDLIVELAAVVRKVQSYLTVDSMFTDVPSDDDAVDSDDRS